MNKDRSTFFLRLTILYIIAGFAGYSTIAYTLLAITPPTGSSQIPPQNPTEILAQVSEALPAPQERAISLATIAESVPSEGKFIAADLVNMKLSLYEDGKKLSEFTIQTKGRPGSPWETPSGFYSVKTKERNHFSSIGKVYMPYSMQFYGNYFIHGWTYYPDGTPTASTFSGGCIKLHTEDAQAVFAFADLGTQVFVYDKKPTSELEPLTLTRIALPALSAETYLVADLDTGDVYAEKNAQLVRPIASITKLMTALVANESISLYRELSVIEGSLVNPPRYASTTKKTFIVGDLFYPLLMQSSNSVADSIASYYGKNAFTNWMNATAAAHGMKSTTFADASGAADGNVSTADDLFRLISYIANKKAFLLKITATQNKTITATDGTKYVIKNLNAPANGANYIGGKVGHTTAAKDTMLAVLEVPNGDTLRRVAIIVLGSNDRVSDTSRLEYWIQNSARGTQNLFVGTPACASCAQEVTPEYRKVEVEE